MSKTLIETSKWSQTFRSTSRHAFLLCTPAHHSKFYSSSAIRSRTNFPSHCWLRDSFCESLFWWRLSASSADRHLTILLSKILSTPSQVHLITRFRRTNTYRSRVPVLFGGPGKIWTSDPTLIKRVLWPTELQAHVLINVLLNVLFEFVSLAGCFFRTSVRLR